MSCSSQTVSAQSTCDQQGATCPVGFPAAWRAPDLSRRHPSEPLLFWQEDAFHALFYREPSQAEVDAFERFLKANTHRTVRLFHGTAARHPIIQGKAEGLLPTSSTRKKSLQSTSGYVYLSVYPDMAATFARMNYPREASAVYAVDVPIALLLPDKDQLRNQRLFAGRQVRDRLADSLVFGHGARVRGKVGVEHLCLYLPKETEG